MKWAVKLLQENFDNVPLALDTANRKAIEAGISVYNRSKGKPIVNSADAGSRIENIDLAAANDAIVIALCSADGIAADNDERMVHCQNLLERGLSLGMESEDLWFDPLFLVIKGMQDKQMEVLEAIKMFSDMGLNSTGGLSQQLQRHAEAHPSDHGRHDGRHVHDAGPDLRDRQPLRPAPDGDHQVGRRHQEQHAVRRLLSGAVIDVAVGFPAIEAPVRSFRAGALCKAVLMAQSKAAHLAPFGWGIDRVRSARGLRMGCRIAPK